MTQIFLESNGLVFNSASLILATVKEYNLADRCIGSIFESLEPGEIIELVEGKFLLDESLDLVKIEE